MVTGIFQTRGFKTAEHKLMGDITHATSIIYTVYGKNLYIYILAGVTEIEHLPKLDRQYLLQKLSF